jgi:hypothetical protein
VRSTKLRPSNDSLGVAIFRKGAGGLVYRNCTNRFDVSTGCSRAYRRRHRPIRAGCSHRVAYSSTRPDIDRHCRERIFASDLHFSGLNVPMLVRLRLKNLSGLCLLRRDVLVEPKEVAWIIVRFDTYEAFPPFAVGLGYAVIFIAAHEIDVHPRSH